MNIIMEYIIEEALILIPVLMVIGKIIKDGEFLNNRYIPPILLIVGVVASVFILGVTADSFIQGVLVTGAAVFLHELFKTKKVESKK